MANWKVESMVVKPAYRDWETGEGQSTEGQKEQLVKDLNYYKGFLESVEKKLSNERFVQNAKPAIIELEQKIS